MTNSNSFNLHSVEVPIKVSVFLVLSNVEHCCLREEREAENSSSGFGRNDFPLLVESESVLLCVVFVVADFLGEVFFCRLPSVLGFD